MTGKKRLEEEIAFSGYVISVTPRTRRGLLEYRLKIMTLGGECKTVYLRSPEIMLRPGIPVRVKAILSRQLAKPRWIVDSIEVLKDLKSIEPVLTRVEEISRGAFFIISGKKEGKMFSIPLQNEEILSKIPKALPQDFYCIFIEHGHQITLAEIMSKKEYEVFKRTLKLVSKLDEESSKSSRIISEYLSKIQGSPQLQFT